MTGTEGSGVQSGGSTTNSSGNTNNQNRPVNNSGGGNKKHDSSLKKTKFEGRIDGLKGHVYDIIGFKAQDKFKKTTDELVDYVGTLNVKYAYDGAEYIRKLSAPDWSDERPTKPKDTITKDSSGKDVVVKPTEEALEDYDADLEEWKAKRKHVNIVLKQAFGIVWSQCSDTIRVKVEKDSSRFEQLRSQGNVVELLKVIRAVMMDYQEHKDINQLHWESLRSLFTCYQEKKHTLAEHRDKFDAIIDQLEYIGVEIGQNPRAIADIVVKLAVDPKAPTKDEMKRARALAKEQFLAVGLIMTADKHRHGNAVETFENNKLLEVGEWPKTRSAAYDKLMEFKADPRNVPKPTSTGMAFTTVGDHHVDAGDDEDVPIGFSFLQASLCTNRDGAGISSWWILLDNQSTVDVFCNKQLLRNIRRAAQGKSIAIASNGGISVTDMVGDLPGYGTVWFDKDGIANILSFANVAAKWKVTIETDKRMHPMFVVHKESGEDRHFVQSEKGLYYYDVSGDDNSNPLYTLINTVDENKSKYSKRDYSRAVVARKLQKRIGRPSTKHLIEILDQGQLMNCPVTSQDVRNAEDIFGPEVGSLKGKTVWRKGKIVIPAPQAPLPVTVMDKYRDVIISIDVMYVNGLAFLVTLSQHIKFTTCEYMESCKDGPILSSLSKVRQLYRRRGFNIREIHGDGRFSSLDGENAVSGIIVNTTARDEHDPNIERNNRTLKDRVRSAYHMLPFNECMPRRIVIELVYACVFWLNCFQPSGGISSSASP